jgi:hypothetical protein
MGDKDVDAQFADIVAHWDDVVVSSEGDRASSTPAVTDDDGYAAGPGPADESPPPRHGVNPPLRRGPVNPPFEPRHEQPQEPPPLERPFVVWRGAVPSAGDGSADGGDHLGPSELAFLDEDDDEHFEPGPLAPLPPQEDLQFWGIIVGLVAGPLLLLWLVIFRPDVSGWWTLGALGLTVAGFVLLVLRQPGTRDEDDPDHGARV